MNYFTASFRAFAARNFGTRIAGTSIDSPVRGFRAVRAEPAEPISTRTCLAFSKAMKSSLMTLVGKAYVDGKLTAEAELKAMIVDK